MTDWSWSLDGPIVATAIACSVAAAIPGCFLVLRRMSLLGDAISHAVLPGLALAFLISGSRSSGWMFVGAVVVGILTAFFTQWIHRVGNVDEGASMGVVFTTLFAIGLVLMVQAADQVDLDAGCVLYGSLDTVPLTGVDIGGWRLPRPFLVLTTVAVLNALFVTVFFKELTLTSFDPSLATTSGFSSRLIHYALMVVVAVTAVASFEAVGSVLVVAMMVIPPAAAYLCTDRLSVMIVLAAAIAVLSAVTGHLSAITVPRWVGFGSTTTAGMMAVSACVWLTMAMLFSPRHGWLPRWVRSRQLSASIVRDDVVAFLYRMEERGQTVSGDLATMQRVLAMPAASLRRTLKRLERVEAVRFVEDRYRLTPTGRRFGQRLVRSHRLWETYLQDQAGTPDQRLHQRAEALEHFTDTALGERLGEEVEVTVDPHGTRIPEDEED